MAAYRKPQQLEYDSAGRIIAAHFAWPKAASTPATQRWLVAVDGSEHALRATLEVLKLAQSVPGLAIDFAFVEPSVSKEASRRLPREAWQHTQAARALADAAGVPWQLHARMGEVAVCLVAQAEASGCCAIAVGTHGRGAERAMLMGSVAFEVLNVSRRSVLVVR